MAAPALQKLKVVILGEQKAGKTSLLTRFMYETFDPNYSATIGIDFLSKTMHLEDSTLRLQLWDTAGQERFRSLVPGYIRDAHLVVLVYNICQLATFQGIDGWAKNAADQGVTKICLLGTNADLPTARMVPTESGQSKAQSLGAFYFGEVSAKTGEGVNEAFHRIALALSGGGSSGDSLCLVRGSECLEVLGAGVPQPGPVAVTRLSAVGSNHNWQIQNEGGGARILRPQNQTELALAVVGGKVELVANPGRRDPSALWEMQRPPVPSKTTPPEQLLFHRGESSYLVVQGHGLALVSQRTEALRHRAGLWQLLEQEGLECEARLLQLHDARRWLATALKCVAGAVRVLAEDLLNAFCQGVFLAKHWHDLARGARLFTLLSIGTAACTSMAGPIKELLLLAAFPRAKKEPAGDPMGTRGDAARDGAQAEPTTAAQDSAVKEGPAPDVEAVGGGLKQRTEEGPEFGFASGGNPNDDEGKKEKDPGALALSDKTIAEFVAVEDENEEHARTSHVLLLLSAVGFWLAMALIPLLFGRSLGCDAMVPSSAILYFILICNACVFVEQWIALHTLQGYRLIRYLPEHIRDIPRGNLRGFHSLFAVFLSMLGRYDTFSDIVFTIVLCKCDTITWFSIWGHVFPLPVPLHYMALFAVGVGVFACQALPGLVLLARRQYLPMAFKFNEFNILLALVEQELVEEGSHDDAEMLAAARDDGAGSTPSRSQEETTAPLLRA